MKIQNDVVIIGAGLVGLATAYNILRNDPRLKVLVIEKESEVGQHQSGHNSGVIHSGIYYKPGSLKAKNCIDGYNSIIKFAEENDIKFDICGKIIVASNKYELPLLDNIYKRGVENGLKGLTYLNSKELNEIEPHCVGVKAIKVPQTGIIDFPAVALKLKEKIINLGGEFRFREKVINIKPFGKKYLICSDNNEFITSKIVSCAGLYSDDITKLTSSNNDVKIIPFRGEYFELKPEKSYLVNNLIYPVPNPNFPFLGVHFTRMINGGVEAGPNAVLAFKKEGYKFTDFNFNELSGVLGWSGFRKVVMKYGKTGIGEIYRSLSKDAFTKALQKLIPEIQSSDLIPGGSGVRAQACDREGNLLDDFDIIQGENIIHVRNAPSPAATSCLSIGETISNLILK